MSQATASRVKFDEFMREHPIVPGQRGTRGWARADRSAEPFTCTTFEAIRNTP